jgi:hypothetical protein
MRILKNRTKPGIPYYLVLIWNRTNPGTTVIETVLTGTRNQNTSYSKSEVPNIRLFIFQFYPELMTKNANL